MRTPHCGVAVATIPTSWTQNALYGKAMEMVSSPE